MTERQINELKATLPKWDRGVRPPLTKKQKILDEELRIREMMISNLCYGGDYFHMVQESWYVRNLGADGYDWDILEKLGVPNAKQRVRDIWEEMKADFEKHATVHHCVHTDSEGLTYNSIEWDDE